MYAIVNEDGRQYKVEEGQQLDLDYRDVPKGSELVLSNVLAVGGDNGLKFGTPSLQGARVTAEVVGPARGQKLFIQKFRRRKNERRRTGHRQLYTRVIIRKIEGI